MVHFKKYLVLYFHLFIHELGFVFLEEQTFLFLTARWNDDMIQWLSGLAHEENLVLFLRSRSR